MKGTMKDKKIIKETIIRIDEDIEKISTTFYQRKDSEAYQALNRLIKELLEFIKNLDAITNDYTPTINLILTEALKALEVKDGVLIADLLKYDLDGVLNQIYVEL